MMNLADLKVVNAPHDALITFIENDTRKQYNSVALYSVASFRSFHEMAAFTVNDSPSAVRLTLGELIDGLESMIGEVFSWEGGYTPPQFTFNEETDIAFVATSRSSHGRLMAWYYDGKEIVFLLTNK